MAAQEQLRQQRLFPGAEGGAAAPPGMPQGFPPFPFPPGTKLPPMPPPNSEQYRQMFSSFMPNGFPGFPPMMPPPGDSKPAAKEAESPAPSNSANV
jgi:hypothetical protein